MIIFLTFLINLILISLFLNFGTLLSIWETYIGNFYHWPNWENYVYRGIFDFS